MLTPYQQKALLIDDHLALTANAGSGKTFVLSRKYLEAAIKLDGKVSSIAAITFTEKAASELYSKISKLIDEELLTATDEKLTGILQRIRRNLVSAYISTIHSFCIDILREFPVEAGIDANFTPIDQSISDELIELSVEEAIDNAFNNSESSDLVKNLLRYFSRKSALQNELINLIQHRKNVLKVQKEIYSKSDEKIVEYYRENFAEYFNEIWAHFESDFIDSVTKINNSALAELKNSETALQIKEILDSYKKDQNPISLLSNLKGLFFTNQGKVRTQKYLGKNLKENLISEILLAEKIFKEFQIFTDELYEELYFDLIKFGRDILFLLDKSLEIYQNKKRDESYIDFEDILIFTKKLLTDPEVQKYLQNKFKYLMIDEFQDTNEIQYQIFLPILDYLKSGKLFIVGDEKQSIYKFRDAELEIFNKTKSDIEKIKSKSHLLSLPDSFRMNPEICLFTNVLFNNLFSKDIPLFGELKNVPIVCAKKERSKCEIQVLLSVVEKSEQTQAEMVANKIFQLIEEENLKFSDITILVRKRKSFEELETVFIRNKIPYTIVGGRGFYQRQEINDIYNYLAFLLNQDDDAALIGILRSPFFNIPDTVLFEISLQKGNSFFKKLMNYTDNSELQSVKKLLDAHIELSSSAQITQLITSILSDTQMLSILNSRADGEQEIANIEKLLSVSRSFDGKGYRNLYDFVHFLKDAIDGEQDESQAAVNLKSDSIQLMTIHQAKGLEFPVVFLFKCDDYGQSVKTKSKSVTISKNFGLLAKIPDRQKLTEKYKSTPITILNDFIEKKKNLAEIKRLLYVAITRAKDRLIITGEIKEGKLPHSESFLWLLMEGLNNNFDKDIDIHDELSFLKESEGKFINETKKIKVTIPVLNNFYFEKPLSVKTQDEIKNNKFYLQEISVKEKSQIISATRIAIYSQCPLKYYLTYNLGFALLNRIIPEWRSTKKNLQLDYDEYESDDLLVDDNSRSSDFYTHNNINSEKIGEIIHKILELELNDFQIKEFLEKNVRNLNLDKTTSEKIQDEIVQMIAEYRKTELFREISSYKNYKNEFEIVLQEGSYFLHGIIDKIIFEKDKILIIDYKTDAVDIKNASQRFNEYSNQLKFYIYISQRLFKDCDFFEARLVFLRLPKSDFKIQISKTNLNVLEREVGGYIEGIINNNFKKNTEHCKNCQFSFNEKCVIQ